MFFGSGIATVNNPGVEKFDDKNQTRTPEQPHWEDNSDFIVFVYARYKYTLTGLRSQIWELTDIDWNCLLSKWLFWLIPSWIRMTLIPIQVKDI